MIEILPAVIPQSFQHLEETLSKIRGVTKRVQVDVVDGHYAKGKSWPYRDSATFDKIVSEEHGLPFWDELDYQFDLMIQNPAADMMRYVTAGASQIIIHAKSEGAIDALQPLADYRQNDYGELSIKLGVALGAHAQPEELEPFAAQYDFVQVMGIEREGRQGEPLDKKAIYLLERLRSRYPELPLQVDGGVTLENAQELVRAGATRLVAGSAIFGADDPIAAYKELYNKVNAG